MTWWKQTSIALALVAAALIIWSREIPAAAPFLALLGLPAAEEPAPSGGGMGPSGRTGFAGGTIRVAGAPVTEAIADGRVESIGDGKALHSVSVQPLAPGRIEAIKVASGQRVEAGDVLAELDSESEAIALDRAKLAAADAEATVARLERLRKSGAATDVELSAAELAVGNARLDVRDAQLALDRRRITAPIGGIIGLLPIERGAQVDTGTIVATIDDRSGILLDFRVPEPFAGRISVGDEVRATALARPELDLVGKIIGLDSRVDPASRTLRVQAALDNGRDLLRGGMAFAIELVFKGESRPAVSPLAIQWNSEGAFVWVERDSRAVNVPVRIVQRDSDKVLVSGDLRPGERVITEGLQRLKPGAAVKFDGDPETKVSETRGPGTNG